MTPRPLLTTIGATAVAFAIAIAVAAGSGSGGTSQELRPVSASGVAHADTRVAALGWFGEAPREHEWLTSWNDPCVTAI